MATVPSALIVATICTKGIEIERAKTGEIQAQEKPSIKTVKIVLSFFMLPPNLIYFYKFLKSLLCDLDKPPHYHHPKSENAGIDNIVNKGLRFKYHLRITAQFDSFKTFKRNVG
jgi:hypothetical protein